MVLRFVSWFMSVSGFFSSWALRSERSGEGESSLHGGVLGATAEAVGSSELVTLAPALCLSQSGADLRSSE